jgi:sugar phosphate isomerase/epimerase
VQGDELKATVEFNATLGNPYLIVPGVNPNDYAGADGAKRLGETLSAASEAARPLGARVGYHNHHWEFVKLPDGSLPIDLIFQNAAPDVILQVDTGNAREGAGDPIPLILKYGDRAVTAHLKPFAADFSHYFVGEDDTDWPAVFAALDKGATKYYIVEQERYPEPNTPLQCVKRCLDNLRQMGK